MQPPNFAAHKTIEKSPSILNTDCKRDAMIVISDNKRPLVAAVFHLFEVAIFLYIYWLMPFAKITKFILLCGKVMFILWKQ